MSQSEILEQYEYIPMNASYGGIGFGYRFGEGVGINASGGVRGTVSIHTHSTNKVFVSVFADTAVRRIAPNSWRQATVILTKADKVLARQVVGKFEPYIIAESSRESYLGSVTLDLPSPVDMTPLQLIITAISSGYFYEGVVPGQIQKATVPIAVRKVSAP